jgi:hypothetical protein
LKPELAAAAGVLLFCAGACDTTYPLPATPCDDHCNAVQRGNCSDDDPAACVRDCEQANAGVAGPDCAKSSAAVDDCLSQEGPSAFFCADNHSQISGVCLSERRALSECFVPGSGACFDQCLRRVSACGAALLDCEEGCHHAPAGCAPTFAAYYSCVLGYPVDCPTSGPDTRLPEDIPCFDEALALLACGQ